MEPRIETIPDKKLIGKRLKMTISNDRTYELWHSFMPVRNEIKNRVSDDLFSLQVYDNSLDFNDFNPDTAFEKWAAAEVSEFDTIPARMETHTLKGGLYAVFLYKGRASDFPQTFHYIFHTWLPASAYEVDKRDHFEILGDKYKSDDPTSEEEVWVPVKIKE